MYRLTDLSKESQTQLEAFTSNGASSGMGPGKLFINCGQQFLMTERECVTDLNKYSVTLARDIPTAVINFLGYMEHIEKTPLEQADAGHLSQYIQYLRSMLKEHAELWAKRILALPLDMFLNFLYAEGYCPSDPVRTA